MFYWKDADNMQDCVIENSNNNSHENLNECNRGNAFGKTSRLHLVAEKKGAKTILSDVSFTAPFKIMRPFYEKGENMSVMQQTASAGIMAGDRQEIDILVKSNANMEIVSQAYEKIHKMETGYASRKTVIEVEGGARLSYMPLPAIPFTGSDFQSDLFVKLEDDSSVFAFREILSCGRIAHGEQFGYRRYQNRISVYRNGHMIYRDNTLFEPETIGMTGFGMYEGYTHLSTLLLCGVEQAKEHLPAFRNLIDGQANIEGGITETAFGDIVVKMLGRSADDLLRIMEQMLSISGPV